MGIKFEVSKKGNTEISLTEYSIKEFEMVTEANDNMDLRHNNLTRDIVIAGVINPEIAEGGEREVSSVLKLAHWAAIPDYEDCYKDISYTITDAKGEVIKEETTDHLKDFYVVEYKEHFSNKEGAGHYRAVLREREVKHKGLNG